MRWSEGELRKGMVDAGVNLAHGSKKEQFDEIKGARFISHKIIATNEHSAYS